MNEATRKEYCNNYRRSIKAKSLAVTMGLQYCENGVQRGRNKTKRVIYYRASHSTCLLSQEEMNNV